MTESEKEDRAKDITFQLLRHGRIDRYLRSHKMTGYTLRVPTDETDKEDRVSASQIVDRVVKEGTLWKR